MFLLGASHIQNVLYCVIILNDTAVNKQNVHLNDSKQKRINKYIWKIKLCDTCTSYIFLDRRTGKNKVNNKTWTNWSTKVEVVGNHYHNARLVIYQWNNTERNASDLFFGDRNARELMYARLLKGLIEYYSKLS